VAVCVFLFLFKATDNKYDRQLRLWGKDGQLRLATANILVIGAGPTATETLKNLVLPGIGKFTTLDNEIVNTNDLGNNFFVTSNDLGRPRAEVVRDLIIEMNPEDCIGSFRVADPKDIIQNEPGFFKEFSLIIATQLDSVTLLALSQICWGSNIPLVIVRSYGYIGYMRLQLKDHEIIESKPDTKLFDLRLSNPFPELLQLYQSMDIDAMSDMDHAHTPYVMYLMKALDVYKASHQGKLPTKFVEKKEFKTIVESMRRNVQQPELNISEAIENSYRAFSPPIPIDIKELVDSYKLKLLNPDVTDFHILVLALGEFIEKEGVMPLTGLIPDMEADNPKYIALQQCYERRAERDMLFISQLAESIHKKSGKKEEDIDPELIIRFCKDAWNLKVVKTRSLEEEQTSPLLDPDVVYEVGENTTQSPALWYLALKGIDRFQVNQGRYPGCNLNDDETSLTNDSQQVWQEMQSFLSEQSSDSSDSSMISSISYPDLTENHAYEMTRFGCMKEFHNVSSFMGGVASQEIIKIITHQWIPANNTFIYNGVSGTAQTIEF